MRIRIEDWEVELIRALDVAKLNPDEPNPEPENAMTPNLFKAIFEGKPNG